MMEIGEVVIGSNAIEEAAAEVEEPDMMAMVEATIIKAHPKIELVDVAQIVIPINEDDLHLILGLIVILTLVDEVIIEIPVTFVNVHVKN